MHRKTLIATLGLTLISTLAQANLIQNGGFESPGFSTDTFTANANVTGWGIIPAVFNGNAGSPWPLAAEGSQYADISNATGPFISQNFSVASGGTYLLRWSENTGYYGNNAPGVSPYLVTVTAVTGNAGTLFSQTFDAYNYGAWENLTQPLSLAPGSYTLSFAPQGVYGGYDSLIDSVSVSNTVPDHTSTAAALGCSVIGLGFASRRLRRILPV